jgi:hypothetical protein
MKRWRLLLVLVCLLVLVGGAAVWILLAREPRISWSMYRRVRDKATSQEIERYLGPAAKPGCTDAGDDPSAFTGVGQAILHWNMFPCLDRLKPATPRDVELAAAKLPPGLQMRSWWRGKTSFHVIVDEKGAVNAYLYRYRDRAQRTGFVGKALDWLEDTLLGKD